MLKSVGTIAKSVNNALYMPSGIKKNIITLKKNIKCYIFLRRKKKKNYSFIH